MTVNSGTVVTHGDYSTGIFAYGYVDTTVNSGLVMTYGYYSRGIFAQSYYGAVTITSTPFTPIATFRRHRRLVILRDVVITWGPPTAFFDGHLRRERLWRCEHRLDLVHT